MNVLVTGGAGFIGSHLIEKLLKDKKIKKVILIDHFEDGSKKNILHLKNNKKLKIYKRDIRDLNNIKNLFKNINVVYHLAAIADIVPSIINPLEYISNNFNGTINVLESMRLNNVKRIIYAASSSCYGITKKIPTSEIEKIQTLYPYAFSKYIAEQAIIHWADVYKIDYISLRLFNVYGPRSRTKGAYGAVMGVFLKQKLLNKPFTIVGNGNQKRDFIYVGDVVDAFVRAGNYKKSNKIFNVGGGNPQKINDLAKLLNGKKTYIPKRPGEPDITFSDNTNIKKYLKWKPKVSLKDGISILLKNINYWKDAPLWTPSKIKSATKEWFKFLS